jgi:uncharacterized iron-regulated protein
MSRSLFIALLVILSLAGSCRSAEQVVRLGDRQPVPFARLIAELKGERLVFIGENHDRAGHHHFQLSVIRALHEAGTPLAIGLEMFTADSQPDLDRWIAGEMEQEDFTRTYYRNWAMPWSLYGDIFLYARRHGIPLIGLNLPRVISRKVAREGFDSLTPEERRQLPPGITCRVDAAYMALIRKAYSVHAGNDKSFVRFCEAQMLWNKSMARRLGEFLQGHPGRTVVVLAGTGHVMKAGIPEEVRRETGVAGKVIIQEEEGLSRAEVTAATADYLVEGF